MYNNFFILLLYSADRGILNGVYQNNKKVAYLTTVIHSFFNKDVVFPAKAEYSYFSADFRLKMFLYYS